MFFFSLFIFPGHSTWEPASNRVNYFILWVYTGTGASFGKNAGEWTRSVEISKEEMHGSKCSMYGNILTYSKI